MSALRVVTSPMTPEAIAVPRWRIAGLQRIHMASMRNTPRSRARSTRDRAWARLTVSGFSHSTALPASSARRAAS
ncbi:MAG TPA: hypothetical protein VE172_18270 [Stackebrandtia sp.]|nr:hypothetical protein [Stackebrandtia sp.]HZE40752.1 hypothetical protein [Stackebrandtia sp.]